MLIYVVLFSNHSPGIKLLYKQPLSGQSTDICISKRWLMYFFFVSFLGYPGPMFMELQLAKQWHVWVTSRFEIFYFHKFIYSLFEVWVFELCVPGCIALCNAYRNHGTLLLSLLLLFHFSTSSNPNGSLQARLIFLTENRGRCRHSRRE